MNQFVLERISAEKNPLRLVSLLTVLNFQFFVWTMWWKIFFVQTDKPRILLIFCFIVSGAFIFYKMFAPHCGDDVFAQVWLCVAGCAVGGLCWVLGALTLLLGSLSFPVPMDE